MKYSSIFYSKQCVISIRNAIFIEYYHPYSSSTHREVSASKTIVPGHPSTRGTRGPFATYKHVVNWRNKEVTVIAMETDISSK